LDADTLEAIGDLMSAVDILRKAQRPPNDLYQMPYSIATLEAELKRLGADPCVATPPESTGSGTPSCQVQQPAVALLLSELYGW
jgi:hypothetical protein